MKAYQSHHEHSILFISLGFPAGLPQSAPTSPEWMTLAHLSPPSSSASLICFSIHSSSGSLSMLVPQGSASNLPSVYTHSLGDPIHPHSCTHFLGRQHHTTYLQEGLEWPQKERTPALCTHDALSFPGSLTKHWFLLLSFLCVGALWGEDCDDVRYPASSWHLFMKWINGKILAVYSQRLNN